MTDLEFLESIVKVAEKAFYVAKEVDLPAICMARDAMDNLAVIPAWKLMCDQQGKNLLEDLMISLAQRGFKQIILVSECWKVNHTDESGIEDCRKWIAEHGSLEKFPGRIEVLSIQSHSAESELNVWAEILPGRKLGEWQGWGGELKESSGRFAEIFRKAQDISSN